MAERETGTVEWFSKFKGYGFLGREGEKDLFVHHSAIRGEGHQVLKEGQQVEFEIVQGQKGSEARDVVVISGK